MLAEPVAQAGFAFGKNLRDETAALRGLCVDRLAGERHPFGQRAAEAQATERSEHRRKHAHLELGAAERRFRSGENQVTAEYELEGAAEALAVDERGDWYGIRSELPTQGMEAL